MQNAPPPFTSLLLFSFEVLLICENLLLPLAALSLCKVKQYCSVRSNWVTSDFIMISGESFEIKYAWRSVLNIYTDYLILTTLILLMLLEFDVKCKQESNLLEM